MTIHDVWLFVFRNLFRLICYNRKWVPDSLYVKWRYYSIIGKWLNLDSPQLFNEKMQWLKLYDRQPHYSKLVDKYEVKQYAAELFGEDSVIPLLGVWDSFNEIDFSRLPDQFVLKCTHDSGGVVICNGKDRFNYKEAKQILESSLKRNFYYYGREWPYKNIKPRIIAEKYMVDESGTELKDYKVFNFNGVPRLIDVDYNRFIKHMRNLYTPEWEYIHGEIEYPTNPDHIIEKPRHLAKMLDMSRKIAEGIPFVRTDFYIVNDKIYLGEITFYHGSGYESFQPESMNKMLGEWLVLPERKSYEHFDHV